MTNPSTGDVPTGPDNPATQDRTPALKRIYIIVASVIVVALCALGVVWITNDGPSSSNVSASGTGYDGDSGNGSGSAGGRGSGSNGTPDGDEPFVDPVPYVDDSGAQEHEISPAPGQFDGLSEMYLSIADDKAYVDPIQVTDTGTLIPPIDVRRLGWYSASAIPGAEGNVGSSVITGHINYSDQGTGFADHFTHLKEGDSFAVGIDGEEKKFRVSTAPYRLQKGSEFPEVVNDATGENKVVLITCGGKFVGGSLGYEDNIITVAERV